MGIKEFEDAINNKDAVKFAHPLKSRGPIGTGNIDDARLNLESRVHRGAKDLQLKHSGVHGFDFNIFAQNWKKCARNLLEFGSLVGDPVLVKGVGLW